MAIISNMLIVSTQFCCLVGYIIKLSTIQPATIKGARVFVKASKQNVAAITATFSNGASKEVLKISTDTFLVR